MALPKGFKKNVKLNTSKVGVERRQELLDDIDYKGTLLPRGVEYEDMDTTFVEFANKDLELILNGDRVPVIFLTIQRWSEFSRTWQHSDKYKDIKLPFITIVRKPDVQVGTNQAGNWNIPGNRGYTYLKVPTFEGGRKGIDVYKIPQPTAVDISYEIRLFCNRMKDLNKLHDIVQKTFNSRQHYLYVNKHPMPLILDTVSDESKIDDFENRRFYVQVFNLKLLGYILSEDDFEVIPTVNRFKMGETLLPEGDEVTTTSEVDVTYNIVFNDLNTNTYSVTTENNITFERIRNLLNVSDVSITVSGIPQLFPFNVSSGTEIVFTITRTNINNPSSFSILGTKI